MQTYDYVIVGSGFYGAVFAQQAVEAGRTVLMLERRSHIGGNCFSEDYQDTGINVHTYGTHIFHTNNAEIWDYVNRFTEFNRYQHRVLTHHRGRVYAMPINLGTINQFFGVTLTPAEVEGFIATKRIAIANPANFEEKALSMIGPELYEAFFKGYTMKQWDCDPRDLPAANFMRLPFRTSYHDSYFNDRWQGIPVGGYTPIFHRMMDGIPIEMGVDYLADPDHWRRRARCVVYTGPIDRYFDYCHGRLRWRSVRFEYERVALDDFQGTSVMNYADTEVPFTRIHEPKHLHLEKAHKPGASVIVREFSQVDHEAPYYPVNSAEDRAMLARYQELAADERGMIFGGRLAEYKYYDMHQVIGAALARARRELAGPA